jgi:hypothetical protein
MRKTMIPMYGFEACPRICSGSTKSQEIKAVPSSAPPRRLNQCCVSKNHVGRALVTFMGTRTEDLNRTVGRLNG